jgi:hypothetical protein
VVAGHGLGCNWRLPAHRRWRAVDMSTVLKCSRKAEEAVEVLAVACAFGRAKRGACSPQTRGGLRRVRSPPLVPLASLSFRWETFHFPLARFSGCFFPSDEQPHETPTRGDND